MCFRDVKLLGISLTWPVICRSCSSTSAAQSSSVITGLKCNLRAFLMRKARNILHCTFSFSSKCNSQRKSADNNGLISGGCERRLEPSDTSRFSPVTWSKLKIVIIQWKKSRIWDTIHDWHINNLAKNQVSAVFYSRVICRSLSPKFVELCMETPCLCPSEGHKHGGRKVKFSVPGFFWVRKFGKYFFG